MPSIRSRRTFHFIPPENPLNSISTHDPMAGHNHGIGLAPSPANGARGLRLIELIGEFAIGLHRAAGNGQQQIPNRLPKCRADGEIQRRQCAWGLPCNIVCNAEVVWCSHLAGGSMAFASGLPWPGKLKPCQTGLGKLRTKRSQLGFNKGGVHAKKLSRRHRVASQTRLQLRNEQAENAPEHGDEHERERIRRLRATRVSLRRAVYPWLRPAAR